MKTLTDIFISTRHDLQSALEGAHRKVIESEMTKYLLLLEAEYNKHLDEKSPERVLISTLFTITARVLSAENEKYHTDSKADFKLPVESQAVSQMASVLIISLTFALIASALLGTTVLTLLFSVMIGTLGYVITAGIFSRSMTMRFISHLLINKEDHTMHETAKQMDIENYRKSLTNLLCDLENILRAADAIVSQIPQELERSSPMQQSSVNRHIEVQFIQDLAEAVAMEDAAYALLLAKHRLIPVIESLGLSLVKIKEDTVQYFSIDSIQNDTIGQLQTVRPAVFEGTKCIAHGYALRTIK